MHTDWGPLRLFEGSRASRRFVLAVTAAYLLVLGFVAWHHEMWRDEADGWLFARDGQFLHIVDWTRHAGTPSLWYFVVAPLARIGLPAQSQQVLHLFIAATAMTVLLTFAPFTRLTKVLIATSYFFSYEYSIIVRSYALAILLAFSVAAAWPSRQARPMRMAILLLLLFNVNAQGFFIAAAFAVLFLAECLTARMLRGRNAGALLVMSLGALVSWLQVRTPPDPARQGFRHVFNGDAFPWLIGNAFFPEARLAPLAFLASLMLLLLTTAVLHRSRESLLLLWFPIASLGVLHSWVWIGGLRHAGFVLIVTLLALWVAPSNATRVDFLPEATALNGRKLTAAATALLLNCALLFSTVTAMRFWVEDTRSGFSGAEEMAQFIRLHRIDRDPIAAHNLTQCEALLPYLPGCSFWYAGIEQNGTYLKWDAAMERALDVPYPVAEARSRRHFGRRRWTLLLNVEMPAPEAHGYRLLYANEKPVFANRDERYWLYQPLHLGPMTAETTTP